MNADPVTNIKSVREVDYQIGAQAFRSVWREAQTRRVIPIVMFAAGIPVEIFRA